MERIWLEWDLAKWWMRFSRVCGWVLAKFVDDIGPNLWMRSTPSLGMRSTAVFYMRSSQVVRASDFFHSRPLSPWDASFRTRPTWSRPPSSARAEAAVTTSSSWAWASRDSPDILTSPELQTRVRAAAANGPLHSIFTLRLCHSLRRSVWFKRGPSARVEPLGISSP